MATENTIVAPIDPKELNELFDINETAATAPVDDNAKIIFNRTNLNEEDLNLNNNPKENLENNLPSTSNADNISITDLENLEDQSASKSEKDLELAALEELVKEEKFSLFEFEPGKEKELKDYSKKERKELIEANLDRIREEVSAKAPEEFFDSLSPLMQMAFKYETDGGTDLKGLLGNLSDFQEVTNFDVKDVVGQEEVIRAYLKLQGDHNTQEIEEELSTLKDTPGALEKKAAMYKPKLEAKHQQIIDKKLKDQEAAKVKLDSDMKNYQKAVLDTITTGEINGIKLTRTNQGMLYEGLTKSVDGFRAFFRSIPGIKTDYAHMAEIYWLATDPKGYGEAKSAAKVAETAANDFKKLKIAGQNKTTPTITNNEHMTPVKQNTIKKKPNLFARPQ